MSHYTLEFALALSRSLYEQLTSFSTEKQKEKKSEREALDAKIEAAKKESLTSVSSSSPEIAKVAPLVRRGILNVGNSCYMNATIQALAECPFLRGVLEKEVQGGENRAKEKAINGCRKKLLEVVTSLQQEPFSRVEANKLLKFFLDLQVKDPGYFIQKASSKKKLKEQMDAALFLEFLADYLGLSFKIKNITLKDAVEAVSLEAVVAATKSVKESSGPDLLVFCIADRFSQNGTKKSTKVELSLELFGAYKLCAIICNPSSVAVAGHYITYVPKSEQASRGWVEYNDSQVSVDIDADTEKRAIIEQHSYLYLYAKIKQ